MVKNGKGEREIIYAMSDIYTHSEEFSALLRGLMLEVGAPDIRNLLQLYNEATVPNESFPIREEELDSMLCARAMVTPSFFQRLAKALRVEDEHEMLMYVFLTGHPAPNSRDGHYPVTSRIFEELA